ncbi:predicted protein [Postia placenta Mad-698-R]|uniref:BTB domain-containing protein n=2 Tax=Rhodonia placenta TaxID=104341 RepID=A0A1X6NEK0_9APHY|nr:hypothetical protein POSPLADRAFT_1175792 [Postia placenta MAD-698-R-SB12]EED80879.1 predicted protein [Postia placenta Mad-698-R]KAF9820066.1 hypothetical protein IEO21_01728 [Postia placenta]OSX67057.1 hypothetical protein POSPLADRAFT_1175792 [Postia placenta MAD-698-R-SB12]
MGSGSHREVHHPTLYYEDGNVVLSAQTQDRELHYFRVHQSILCRHSPILADMFSIPPLRVSASRDTLAEVYDGVPHVQMPDSAEDLASFLHVLYDPLGTAYKRFNPDTPVLVQGTLKLATKYECDALRTRIVENLEADWPQTLAQWDARRAEGILARSEHSQQFTGKVNGLYLDDRLPEPASAIRIASDYHIPSILPAAFYQLALLSTDADWDTYRANPGKHLRFGARTARWRLLDKRDLMRLVHGQRLLASYTREIGTIIFGKRCQRGIKTCAKARGDCWKYFQEDAPNSMDDPLDILYDCSRLDTLFTDIPCAACVADIATMAEKKRRELWRSLPAFFNLQ